MSYEVNVQTVVKSRLPETDFNNLPFGHTFSDHMFVADYHGGQWQDCKVVPYGPIEISPANMALHYGQTVFEGMKAHRTPDGGVALFREDAHLERINRSMARLGMPMIPADLFRQALDLLLEIDQDWVPNLPDSSLYLRPLVFATDGFLGVRSSETFRFIIMTGPTGSYYSRNPRLWVEEYYVRAALKGGTGFAKTAGNYASSIMPAGEIRKKGFDQILWLDANEYRYIQECGTMNVFVVINEKIITPPLSDGILAGITRDSLLKLMADEGLDVEVRNISIDEITEAHEAGTLREIFGAGTAAVISHVDDFHYKDKVYKLPEVSERPFGPRLKQKLEAIKEGKIANNHGWLRNINKKG